jgi:non-ribosomal peptide synthase protein (TIGR01720 family)
MQGELGSWLAAPRRRPARLPVDHPGGINDTASVQSLSVTLDREKTRRLREQVARTRGMQIGEVLLAGLARGLASWTGSRSLVIDLEGHGREDLFEDVDLSRTVGWLTCFYPLLLEVEAAEPEDFLVAVKSRLRRVPNGGVGYGILRYLSPDPAVRGRLEALSQAEVSFNYLGRTAIPGKGEKAGPESILAPAPEPAGPSRSPRAPRTHLLEVEGSIADEELHLKLVYSENLHRRATIEALGRDIVASLELLLDPPQPRPAVGYTAADFPAANLSPEDLESLLRELR